jgi:hypothetical protein
VYPQPLQNPGAVRHGPSCTQLRLEFRQSPRPHLRKIVGIRRLDGFGRAVTLHGGSIFRPMIGGNENSTNQGTGRGGPTVANGRESRGHAVRRL